MNIEQSGLSVDQARNRVLAALAERYPDLSFRVQDHAMLAREFGWVFTLEIVGVRNTTAVTKGPIPRLALVNRTSAQAISTSRSYTPERLATLFERLLASSLVNARNWCLTMASHLDGKPVSIAEEAQAAGLEELAAALKDREQSAGQVTPLTGRSDVHPGSPAHSRMGGTRR